MVNDPRDPSTNVCRVCKNFDAFTDKYRLIPYRDSETGDTGAATNQIVNFLYTGGALYGLGVVTGTARVEVFNKTDFTNQTWLTPANNTSASGARAEQVFVYYKTTSKIYGLKGAGSGTVWSFDVAGGAFGDSVQAVNYTNTAQGIVHSKDDMLYIPYDNKIMKFDGSTWTVPVLTLPTSMIITSICEYGNYLAIGCRPVDIGGKSRVYLWDRDTTLATLPQIVDWGNNDLYVLEELQGYLIGISESATNNFNYRLTCKFYSEGSGAVTFRELIASTSQSSGSLRQAKQKSNSRLYFMASVTLNGTVQEGVWSIGRNSANVPFGLVVDRTPNNDTATVNGLLNGFFLTGDYMFISYQTNSAYAMSKTNDTSSYTATAIYETTINPGQPDKDSGERSRQKQLLSSRVGSEPLPTAGSVVSKYRVDSSAGSFTTMTTDTTDGSTGLENGPMDAAGTAITSGREYELHIESTGGAVITGYKYKIEENMSLL